MRILPGERLRGIGEPAGVKLCLLAVSLEADGAWVFGYLGVIGRGVPKWPQAKQQNSE